MTEEPKPNRKPPFYDPEIMGTRDETLQYKSNDPRKGKDSK